MNYESQEERSELLHTQILLHKTSTFTMLQWIHHAMFNSQVNLKAWQVMYLYGELIPAVMSISILLIKNRH